MVKPENLKIDAGLSREDLESLAVEIVCACLYYDLVDNLRETTDKELLKIIEGLYCGDCVDPSDE